MSTPTNKFNSYIQWSNRVYHTQSVIKMLRQWNKAHLETTKVQRMPTVSVKSQLQFMRLMNLVPRIIDYNI